MNAARSLLALSTALVFVLQVPLSVGYGGVPRIAAAQAASGGRESPTPQGVTINPWPMQRYNETHSGMSPSTAPNTNAILWQNLTGPNTWSSPAIADGKVFIGAQTATGDYMFAFYQENGTLAWKRKTQNNAAGGNGLTSSPAYANGLVFFGSDAFYALWANNGTIKWRYTSGNLNYGDGTPTVWQDKLFIPGSDRKLYKMDQQTSAIEWTFQTDWRGNDNYGLFAAPAIWNNFVYLAACDGFVYQLDVNQPGPVATALHTFNTGITGREDAMYGSPVVYDGMVIIGDGYYGSGLTTNRLFALNAMDISQPPIWSFYPGRATSYFGSAAVGYNTIFTGSIEGYLYAINPVNGSKIWEYRIGNTWSSPAIADNKVFIGSKGGTFYAFDVIQPLTPAPKWTYPTGGDVSSAPAVADERVCVGSNGGGGRVFCFGSQVTPPDNPPVVTAFEPGGTAGQSFVAGTQVQVRWKATDDNPMPVNNINISYGFGTSWTRIIGNTANDGTQTWDTTGVPAGNYYINVSAFDSKGQSGWDLGNFTFQITAAPDNPPIVSAWEPGGTPGQVITAGQMVQVRWSAIDDHPLPVNNINVSYGTGGSWTNIIRNTANSGTYQWTTTGVPAGDYYINVSAYDSAGQSSWDLGNSTFRVNVPVNQPPTVNVLQPVGGEVWSGNSAVTIRWDMNDIETPPVNLVVFINYTCASGGGPITGPLTGLAPPYTYLWTLPAIDATDVVVRIDVLDAGGAKGMASSPQFEIDSTRPFILSTWPGNGATSVPTNTNVQVDWSEGMNQSATQSSFALRDNATWTQVAGQLSWSGESLIFNPNVDLGGNGWYTANITLQAKDDSTPGNNVLTPYSWSFRTAAAPDNQPPSITDVLATPATQEVHLSVNVSAVVTDDIGVSTVSVNISRPSGPVNASMSFDSVSGRYYFITSYHELGVCPFTIWATDTSGNLNHSSLSFRIVDTTPPVIRHNPIGQNYLGNATVIIATVTDNFLLQEVRLNYSDSLSISHNVSMTAIGADRFSYAIPSPQSTETIYYYIWAVDSSGNGARFIDMTILYDYLRPRAPMNLTVSVDGYAALRLNWTAPTTYEDGSPLTDLVGYNIYRMNESGGQRVRINTNPVTATTYLDNNGLQDGTTYFYVVSAVNQSGMESRSSNEASEKTLVRDAPAGDGIMIPVIAGTIVLIVIVIAVILVLMARKKKRNEDEVNEPDGAEQSPGKRQGN